MKNNKLENFSLKWRFTEAKYNILPIKYLLKIKHLPEAQSLSKWNLLIKKNISELIQSQKIYINSIKLEIQNCGWGNKKEEKQTRIILQKKIPFSNSHNILFFWGPKIAVETKWNIFIKYWSDFCYPSDDYNILLFETSKNALVYIEDKMLFINSFD